jgi:hypothetical protein
MSANLVLALKKCERSQACYKPNLFVSTERISNIFQRQDSRIESESLGFADITKRNPLSLLISI